MHFIFNSLIDWHVEGRVLDSAVDWSSEELFACFGDLDMAYMPSNLPILVIFLHKKVTQQLCGSKNRMVGHSVEKILQTSSSSFNAMFFNSYDSRQPIY